MGFDNQGPWGDKNSGGNSSKNSSSSSSFESFFNKLNNKYRIFPDGGNNFISLRVVFLLLFVLVLLWLSTGLYRVNEKQQAVILRFGAVTETVKDSGLNCHLPYPIEEHLIQEVSKKRSFNVGINTISSRRSRDEQVFMLTSDENILDVNVTVHWFIKDLGQFLFRVLSPETTIRVAAESAVREVIAQTPMEDAFTKGKQRITILIQDLLQKLSDEYQIGIQVDKVNLEKVEAPPSVIDAFRDVQSAEADKERKVNEALGYRDSIVPVARGEAEKIIQEAEAYRQAVEVKSLGDSQRFISILHQYRSAPSVTRKRMYLETMEEIFGNSRKILISSSIGSGQGVLPYLPLPGLYPNQRNVLKSQKGVM